MESADARALELLDLRPAHTHYFLLERGHIGFVDKLVAS